MRHGDVAEAARRWMHIPYQRVAMKEVELPSGKRIDVLGYEPRGGALRIVECKATTEDLRRAPGQLDGYRQWADLLYLAVPGELEAKARALLPPKTGLLVVGEVVHVYYGRPVNCTRRPRRVPVATRERAAMVVRAFGWLAAHYEATRECKNCGHNAPHGPT